MDHLNILKRSWQILWRYRALWFFGIILAITASSTRAPGGSGSSYTYGSESILHDAPQSITLNSEDWDSLEEAMDDISGAFSEIFDTRIPMLFGANLLALSVAFVCFGFILAIVFTILRYIANTSLIRMVDEYDDTEERYKVGKGFRLGWSRASWRIFLIDLVINIPLAIAIILLLALSATPALLWFTQSNIAGILGTITAIGLFFLAIIIVIVATTAIKVLRQFFHRVSALQDLGVFESIKVGYQVARQNLKDSALMWLILLGVQIAYNIGAAIVGFILLLPAIVLGGGAGLLAGGFGNLFQYSFLPWVLGGFVGIPIFILILGVPMLFLGGLKEVYFSSAWTMTYRELNALEPAVLDAGVEPLEVEPVEPKEE